MSLTVRQTSNESGQFSDISAGKNGRHIVCRLIRCKFMGPGCTPDIVHTCPVFKEAYNALEERNFSVMGDVVICNYCGAENGAHNDPSCPNRFAWPALYY